MANRDGETARAGPTRRVFITRGTRGVRISSPINRQRIAALRVRFSFYFAPRSLSLWLQPDTQSIGDRIFFFFVFARCTTLYRTRFCFSARACV